jgi:tyrosine-protein kinase Etk/Wzc
MTSARYMRQFTESEYQKRMAQLDTAYRNLQSFQEEHKTISLTEQLQATVQSAALLASQVQQLEIQLGVEQRELTPSAARVEMLRAQLEEAKRQLSRYDDGSIGEFSIALNQAPELIRKLAGLTREVKLLETISAFMRQQLEQERLNEHRNIPTFTILDSAIVPKRKSSPKRLVALILSIFVGIAFSGIYVGYKRFRTSVEQNPDDHRKYLAFRDAIRSRK